MSIKQNFIKGVDLNINPSDLSDEAGVDCQVPLDGRKGSGYGSREQGTYAKECYTIVKTAYTLPL